MTDGTYQWSCSCGAKGQPSNIIKARRNAYQHQHSLRYHRARRPSWAKQTPPWKVTIEQLVAA